MTNEQKEQHVKDMIALMIETIDVKTRYMKSHPSHIVKLCLEVNIQELKNILSDLRKLIED